MDLGSEITGFNREQLGSCGSCGAVGPQRSLYELRVRMRGKTRGQLFGDIVRDTMNLDWWGVGPDHALAKGSSRSGRETSIKSKGARALNRNRTERRVFQHFE